MKKLPAATPWVAIPVLIIVFAYTLPIEKISTFMGWLFLAGTVLLAVPTIRINEQGRRIARISPLIAGIEELENNLKNIDRNSKAFKKHQADLLDRRDRLTVIEKNLISSKGAWTSPVHGCLYGGYGLILAAAVIRIAFQ